MQTAEPPSRTARRGVAGLAERAADWARRARPAQVFLLALAVMFGLHATWALITPLGGSPDEIAHITKATGVAHGQTFGEDVDGTQLRSFTIPTGIRAATDDVVCTTLQPDRPAGCDFTSRGDDDGTTTVTSSAGLYNPVYYALIGWPALLSDGPGAIFGMRLVSGLLDALFFAAAVTCISLLPRARLATLATVGAITPTVAFLGGMVNPNALEVATVTAFAAALHAALALQARGRMLVWLCSVMAVSGALGMQARSLTPLWLVVAALIIAIIAGWRSCLDLLRRPATLVALAVVAAAGVAALFGTLSSGTLVQMGDYEGQGARWDVGLRVTLFTFFEQVPYMVGMFGWNDAPIPQFAVVTFLVLVIALVGAATIGTSSVRGRVGVLAAFVAVPLLPAIAQGASVTQSGYIWQGRYGLALVATLVIAAGVVASPVFERLGRVMRGRVIVVALALIALSHVAGMQVTLHRYGSGVVSEYSTLLMSPSWTPFGLPMIVPVLAVWVVVAAWAAGVAVLVQAADRPGVERAE
ncbi:MAG: DUF2142 domain-containing protein [Pseudoclavibacter sp.]